MDRNQTTEMTAFFQSTKAVRVNETIYSIDPSTGVRTLYTGKDQVNIEKSSQFDIVAGDITKPGNQLLNPNAPVLPMDRIPLLLAISEFIPVVDESKLLKYDSGEVVLADNWWECFSFIAR